MVDATGEGDIESPEVDQLAGGIDFRLLHCLALTQHRCGVQCVPPWSGEQVSRAEEHRCPLLEPQIGPSRSSRQRSVDGLVRISLVCICRVPQDVGVIGWHRHIERRSRSRLGHSVNRRGQLDGIILRHTLER